MLTNQDHTELTLFLGDLLDGYDEGSLERIQVVRTIAEVVKLAAQEPRPRFRAYIRMPEDELLMQFVSTLRTG